MDRQSIETVSKTIMSPEGSSIKPSSDSRQPADTGGKIGDGSGGSAGPARVEPIGSQGGPKPVERSGARRPEPISGPTDRVQANRAKIRDAMNEGQNNAVLGHTDIHGRRTGPPSQTSQPKVETTKSTESPPARSGAQPNPAWSGPKKNPQK